MRRTTIAALTVLAAALLPAQAAAALADAAAPTAPTSPSVSPSTTPSPSASASTGPTPTAAPGAVRRLAWRAIGDGAELTWAPPETAPAPTGYRVVVSSPGAADRTETMVEPVLRLPGVPGGTRLAATVTATAGGVDGPATAAPSWTVPTTPPDAPAAAELAPIAGRAAVRVAWSPPTGGTAPTGYVIELLDAASPTTVTLRRAVPATLRSVDFPDLRTGRRWFATVAATTAAGAGAARETNTALLPGPTTTCTSCSAQPAAQPERSAAPVASAPAAAPVATAATSDSVPVSSGFPMRLALAVAGIVLAAAFAIAAVLVRRRTASG